MRTMFGKFMSCAGALFLAFSMVPSASAKCGLPAKQVKPASWHPQYGAASRLLVGAGLGAGLDDRDEHEASIVGFWHVIFTAKTANPDDIPAGGAVIDNAVVVWHSDGTEIMNSARSAQDGNFCLGVWERTGVRTYYINHIPWQGNVFDPTVPPDTIGQPQDGGQIIEKITLSPDGNSYSGTFILKAYKGGTVYQTFTGVISAKRITVNTPFSDLL